MLSFYVVADWREGCERCKQILRYGGMGHTMSIHSQNEQVILEFGLKKPAFRIVRQHADDARVDRADDGPGSGDDARLRRLRRQHHVGQHLAAAPAEHQAAGLRDRRRCRTASSAPAGAGAGAGLPRRPPARRAAGRHRRRTRWPAGSTSSWRRAATGRAGLAGPAARASGRRRRLQASRHRSAGPAGEARSTSSARTMCGRRFRQGRKLVVGERAIVTPAARDLGEQHQRLRRMADWPALNGSSFAAYC